MKVSELIERLQNMPADAEVLHLWDGHLRTGIEHVWLTRDGRVGTGDHGEVCYDTEERPVDAPTQEENRYWATPKAAAVTPGTSP
jgi:hypothetical protein